MFANTTNDSGEINKCTFMYFILYDVKKEP